MKFVFITKEPSVHTPVADNFPRGDGLLRCPREGISPSWCACSDRPLVGLEMARRPRWSEAGGRTVADEAPPQSTRGHSGAESVATPRSGALPRGTTPRAGGLQRPQGLPRSRTDASSTRRLGNTSTHGAHHIISWTVLRFTSSRVCGIVREDVVRAPTRGRVGSDRAHVKEAQG